MYAPSDVEDAEGDSSSEDSEESNWSDEDASGKIWNEPVCCRLLSFVFPVPLLHLV